jgi:hypothetical protein
VEVLRVAEAEAADDLVEETASTRTEEGSMDDARLEEAEALPADEATELEAAREELAAPDEDAVAELEAAALLGLATLLEPATEEDTARVEETGWLLETRSTITELGAADDALLEDATELD